MLELKLGIPAGAKRLLQRFQAAHLGHGGGGGGHLVFFRLARRVGLAFGFGGSIARIRASTKAARAKGLTWRKNRGSLRQMRPITLIARSES